MADLRETAVDPMTGRRAQRPQPQPPSREVRGLMASARDPLSSLLQRSTELSPLYGELVDFLAATRRMPTIEPEYLREGNPGRFINYPGYTDIGRIELDPTQAMPNTPVHELTHAADRTIDFMYSNLARKRRNTNDLTPLEQQFMQAYEKLSYGLASEKQPLKRREMAERLDPIWTEKNRRYRATQDELAAFGAGSTAYSERDYAPPLHLDPTMATEFNLLLDMANRVQAAQPQPTYTRTRE